MGFKTILVPIEQHDLVSSTLQTALLLARKFDSYIEGFALRVEIPAVIAVGDVAAVPFTAKQYRAKAAEYTELLKAPSLPAETREFRKLEQSYLTLAENEEWMADNLKKINARGADENWYGDAILTQGGKHTPE